jgi:hypothetical protein
MGFNPTSCGNPILSNRQENDLVKFFKEMKVELGEKRRKQF